MKPEYDRIGRIMELAGETGWLRAQLKIHAWRVQDAIRSDSTKMLHETAESMIRISEMTSEEIMNEIKKNEEEHHALSTRNDNR